MRLIYLGFCLLILRLGYGHDDIPKLKDYTIEVWSTEQGLPSNNLIRIDQDRKGFLWITSYNGLIRFDGNSFDIFNTELLPELKSNGFSFIARAKNYGMYFGTLTSGLLTYDGDDFSLERIDKDFSASINTIHTDKQGRLWLGVTNNGLYFKDNSATAFQHVEHVLLENSIVQCMLEFETGELWIATNNNGIVSYRNGEFSREAFEVLDGLSVTTLIDVEGQQYAGTNKGLYVKQEEAWHLVQGTEDYFINSIKEDPHDYLWIATETGIIRISPNGKIEYLTEKDGLPSRQISSVLIDNEENIWLTSKRGGLAQLRNSNFVNLSEDDGLSSRYSNIIYQLNDGSFMVGNDNGGLDIIGDGKVQPLNLKTVLRSTSIKDIVQDDRNNIWVATYRGLLRLSNGSEHLYTMEGGMLSHNIRSLHLDQSGNLWVGAKDGGIIKINERAQRTIFTQADGLSDTYVFCFAELSDGRVIAGTYHGGLNIISPDNTIKVINIGLDNSSPLIFNIAVENDSTYWMATDVGLYRYKSGKFKKLDQSGGLPVATIFDIVIDEFGYLWTSSNLGLVRLQKEEVEAYFEGQRRQVGARLYDEKDGMDSRECTGATKMLVAANGEIWIPTSMGISIVNPARVYTNKIIPPVYIKSITVDNIVYSSLESVIVKPENQRLTFDFTALSYYSPQKIKFKYRLKGYDTDWQEGGNSHEAVYMNLPDGNFTFEVIAANNDGYWNEVPATVAVVIEPYFYTSRLFYLLLIGLGLIIIFVIYWIRIRVVEEKNRELHKLNAELDSFVYSVSHDLRAPLSSILGLISVSKIDKDSNNLKLYLDKIETSVNKLDDFIKEIISYSRNVRLDVVPEDVNLQTMVEETLESLAYMNTDNAIEVSVEAKGDTTFRTDKTRLQVILNNVISNAFRYNKKFINDSFIKVRISIINARATIVVEDNGIGIKRDQQKKIFDMFYRATESSNGSGLGLYIARESAEKIEGKISVVSEYQKGSTFTISLISL